MERPCGFMYDGRTSSDLNLKIVSLSRIGVNSPSVGVSYEIEEEWVKGKIKPAFYGAYVNDKIRFTMQLALIKGDNPVEMTPQTLGATLRWLLKKEYRPLKLLGDEYQGMIVDAMIDKPKQIKMGDKLMGIEFTVECNSAYGYIRREFSYTVEGSKRFTIQNLSLTNEDVNPEIEFKTDINTFQLMNESDNRDSMSFQNLQAGETIYINNENGVLMSDMNDRPVLNFNFNWIRIVPQYYNTFVAMGKGTLSIRINFPVPFPY